MRTIWIAMMFTSAAAHAGVVAYSGPAAEKLFIEAAPKLGKDVYLMKFEGVESKWADKVIKVTKEVAGSGTERYFFDYDLELSTGVQKKTYYIVVDSGFELVKGSRVKKIEMFFQEKPRNDHMYLDQDKELTTSSQKMDLAGQYKKTPFKPDVD